MDNCIFCAIVERRAPASVVYEDATTLAFLDLHPSARGHTLVISKAHFENVFELEDGAGDGILRTVARVARGMRRALEPDGLNVLQANGRVAGQSVFHLHFHLIPRWAGDHLPVPRHPERAAERSDLDELAQQIRKQI